MRLWVEQGWWAALLRVVERWTGMLKLITSALGTALPSPLEIFHVLLDKAADWVEIPEGEKHRHFGQDTE